MLSLWHVCWKLLIKAHGGGKSLDFCRLCANSLQKSNDHQKRIYKKQILFSHLNCLNSSARSVT